MNRDCIIVAFLLLDRNVDEDWSMSRKGNGWKLGKKKSVPGDWEQKDAPELKTGRLPGGGQRCSGSWSRRIGKHCISIDTTTYRPMQ